MSGQRGLPEALDSQLVARFGPLQDCVAVGRGTQSRVWRVRAGGQMRCVKVSGEVAGMHRELRALRAVGPHLLGRVPHPVEDLSGPPPATVMPWIPASPATELAPDDPDLEAVMRQAGKVKRRLQDIETEPDPVPLREALQRRLQAWTTRGIAALGSELTGMVRDALRFEWTDDVPRSWCHRDFEPRNWLIERRAGKPWLWVVDFGQARVDVWLWDLVKLDAQLFELRPELRAAFFEGYGRALTSTERAALRELVLLHGYQCAVWGHEHADPSLQRLGRSILGRRLTF